MAIVDEKYRKADNRLSLQKVGIVFLVECPDGEENLSKQMSDLPQDLRVNHEGHGVQELSERGD